jgi:hypothetical protein
MAVGSQAWVIGKVPARVIRVVVEYDIVAVPIPVSAIADIVGRYGEVVSAKPKAVRTASTDAPNVAAADFAREMSVLPGTIEMIVRVVAARIVTDPLVIRMHVRRLGVARLVTKRATVL